ncbi:biotin transport system ATP-binding protein [Mycolicibacterium mucogenicum 261Sha1.1M5]|uniref:energy-coupling factor ABC transporter ATP-binding protein n=1 Tax=Leucobacter aridicollis TaxID=283878 RepID=UPI000EB3D33E|nr:energy-coupling factor ABC transporter ATP-binding protein [Leucobacter aridicollis]MCS3428790.1 biotin transport system ATP-binding protein [Leucobacter aridicollis]RKQ89957.1 biotin transport system ATP-binding protein [Mycolicibacterium mucogenicum 261Sha1.1M5]
MISFNQASVVSHDGATILHPFSLELTEQRVAVIGANGSGKSTLARLINGLVEPSSGTVTIAEADDSTSALDTVADGSAVRRAVGFVFTDPAAQLIMPTVIEDVELSLRREHRDASDRRLAAVAALARFGLDGFAERSVHALSGGQQQLLAIATVLATGPRILVTDEPTTLLDLRNTRVIGDLLTSLPQQVVIVTHNLDLAARTDRVLVIDQGRIVFDGEPAAAIAHYRDSVAAA